MISSCLVELIGIFWGATAHHQSSEILRHSPPACNEVSSQLSGRDHPLVRNPLGVSPSKLESLASLDESSGSNTDEGSGSSSTILLKPTCTAPQAATAPPAAAHHRQPHSSHTHSSHPLPPQPQATAHHRQQPHPQAALPTAAAPHCRQQPHTGSRTCPVLQTFFDPFPQASLEVSKTGAFPVRATQHTRQRTANQCRRIHTPRNH